MLVRTRTVRAIGSDYGRVYSHLVSIRDPKRDPYNPKAFLTSPGTEHEYLYDEMSQLRSRMLERLLQDNVVMFIPRELAEEVRDGFFEYAEGFPYNKEPSYTAVISDVAGTRVELETQNGRRFALLTYLGAYRRLRVCEKDLRKKLAAMA